MEKPPRIHRKIKMANPISPKNPYPLYIFPSSPKIQSKISTNIKTLIHPLAIPNIAKITLTLLPKAKSLLHRISKEANAHLRIPPSTMKMLLSFLESIDIKAFIKGFVIPCLKKLMKIVREGPRRRSYAVFWRLRLSFSRKFNYRIKKSASSSYFRFHYNWSSRSYMFPVPTTVLAGCHSNSYRFVNINKGNSIVAACSNLDEEGNEEIHDSQLNGYLEWLEQREHDQDPTSRDSSSRIIIDVNMLAEKFIEENHEMFILEKQESERRFQEMMARSL